MEISVGGIAVFQIDEDEWLSKICSLNTIYHEGYYYGSNAILTVGLQIPDCIVFRDDNHIIGCYSNELNKVVSTNCIAIYKKR